VVPQFADVVRDFGTRPDPLVSTVILISDVLRQKTDVIGAICAIAFGAAFFAARIPAIRKRLFMLLAGLPMVSGIIVLRRTTFLCRSLGMLLANGVSLTDALR